MSEKRFSYGETDLFEWVEDNGEMISTKECVDRLNEQQATIRKLQDLCGESDGENARLRIENEKLRQSRDYWSKKTKEHIYYWNCLEKAIEKVFDSDDQCFDEIWKHYDEMEAKWEDEE